MLAFPVEPPTYTQLSMIYAKEVAKGPTYIDNHCLTKTFPVKTCEGVFYVGSFAASDVLHIRSKLFHPLWIASGMIEKRQVSIKCNIVSSLIFGQTTRPFD